MNTYKQVLYKIKFHSNICNCVRLKSSKVEQKARKQLVILGSGWGSYSVLKNIDKNMYDVIVVSARNHFLFTPLLASTTVGTLEFRSIIEPVRETHFRQSDHFHLAKAMTLNLDSKTVMCKSLLKSELDYEISFDKLVIGIGAISNTFNVPGVEEYALFLKEVSDARLVRDKLLANIELAMHPSISPEEKMRLLHVVVVGGGPTGVEFGAELYDFVQEDIKRLYKGQESYVQVTLIESNKILASFDSRLQAYAEKQIKRREKFHLMQSSVTDVQAERVVLKTGDVIPCGLVVWSTGVSPRPFVKNLAIAKKNDRTGQILTDRYLNILLEDGTTSDSVYAIGDCADVHDVPLPCTAQVAERQGLYLASMLNHPDQIKPFEFKSMGMLAYLGGYSALTDIPKFKIQGFPSWLLWRSAYLTRLGSWRLRMQVPIDWLKTLLFGRDTSRF